MRQPHRLLRGRTMNEGLKTCGKPSRGRYAQGCRCFMCKVANTDYERERTHGAKPRMVGYPQVLKARKKVQGWLDEGRSLREICRATGVGRSAMRTLMKGEHPNAARHANGRPKVPKRMSRGNYDAIMGCSDPIAPGDNTLVDATSLNNALKWLYAHGVTPYRVSKVSGIPLGSIYHLGEKGQCTYATLARLTAAAKELKAEALEA